MTSMIQGQALASFGQPVTYLAVSGSSFSLTGIFDRSSTELNLGPGAPISSTHPTLSIRLSDLLPLKPVRGDQIQIGLTIYKVIDVQEDGQGGASLRLQK